MVFLFKLFLLKKKKKAKQTTHKPFLVRTMASLRKNAEKVIKSLGAEFPGRFTEYS